MQHASTDIKHVTCQLILFFVFSVLNKHPKTRPYKCKKIRQKTVQSNPARHGPLDRLPRFKEMLNKSTPFGPSPSTTLRKSLSKPLIFRAACRTFRKGDRVDTISSWERHEALCGSGLQAANGLRNLRPGGRSHKMPAPNTIAPGFPHGGSGKTRQAASLTVSN